MMRMDERRMNHDQTVACVPDGACPAAGFLFRGGLLNLITWRLHEKGMPLEDECYYWINVIMAIVPGIDYPMLAKLPPWCMKQTGYEAWLPVLEAAVQETRIAETEAEGIPEGCFAVYCELPESLQACSDLLMLTFLDENWKVVGSIWPDVRLTAFLYILEAGDILFAYEAGRAYELPTAGLVNDGEDISSGDGKIQL